MRGDGQNQLKISAPHPMTVIYLLIPLSATLISLDSPFKQVGDHKSKKKQSCGAETICFGSSSSSGSGFQKVPAPTSAL
jgi:hypothetical protein